MDGGGKVWIMDGIVYYARAPKGGFADESKLARRMLQQGFAEFFQSDFRDVNLKRERYGKPYYESQGARRQLSISHCREGVAVVVSNRRVGIDMEGLRRVNTGTVKKCCGEKEACYVFGCDANSRERDGVLPKDAAKRFLKLWTLKESYIKMTGEGLRTPLGDVCFELPDEDLEWTPRLLEVMGTGQKNQFFLYTMEDFVLALAAQGTAMRLDAGFLWKEYRCLD